jgi:hypothetical protein
MNSSYKYGGQTAFGISLHTETWVAGVTPLNFLSTDKLAQAAKLHRTKIVPTLALTRQALRSAFGSRKEDPHRNTKSERVLGFKSLLPAVTRDVVKPIYHFIKLTLALSKIRLGRRGARKEVFKEVLRSLSISLETTFVILIKLGLETPETLHQQIQEGDIVLFMALARILEAFASRFAPSGTIYLASGKALSREHCPDIALDHFDQIHDLKYGPIFVDFTAEQIFTEAATAIKERFPCFIQALKGSALDRDDDRISWIVWQAICGTRDDMVRMTFLDDEIEKYKEMPSRIAQGELSG